MAENCSLCLDDAMEGLWFHHNILSSVPKEGLRVNFMSEKVGNSSTATSEQPTHVSATRSEDRRKAKSTEHKKRKPIHNTKKPTTLSVVISKPDFQVEEPLPPCEFRSCPSLPTTDTSPRPSRRSKSTMSEKMRTYKSLSELEYYEVKGFMDLGFVFHKDNLSPDLVGMIPGLQRLGKQGSVSEDEQQIDEEQVRRPYLSESWLINRPDSPLLNLRKLPKFPEGADMKKHLRFWAKNVASLAQQER